jgi:hypothetical protein
MSWNTSTTSCISYPTIPKPFPQQLFPGRLYFSQKLLLLLLVVVVVVNGGISFHLPAEFLSPLQQ